MESNHVNGRKMRSRCFVSDVHHKPTTGRPLGTIHQCKKNGNGALPSSVKPRGPRRPFASTVSALGLHTEKG